MKHRSSGLLCLCLFTAITCGAESVEVRNVTNDELKKMAQFEKDHAEKARASAIASRTLAEKKQKQNNGGGHQ